MRDGNRAEGARPPRQHQAACASVEVTRAPRARQRTGTSRGRLLRRIWRSRASYLLLLPFYAPFSLFVLGPVLANFSNSLQHIRPNQNVWVGLANYSKLLDDPVFWKALSNTMALTAGLVPLILAISLGIAAVASDMSRRWRSYYRMAFYLPVVASAVVLSLIWLWILNPIYGLLNFLIGLVGISPVTWLGSTETALGSVLLVLLSFSLGGPVVLFMAGIDGIPGEIFEAAQIDGASRRQQFSRITVPLLRPTIAFVLIVATIGTFQVFTVVQILTNGGPANATQTLVFSIYQTAFSYLDLGYAAAMSVVLLGLSFVIAVIQMRLVVREISF